MGGPLHRNDLATEYCREGDHSSGDHGFWLGVRITESDIPESLIEGSVHGHSRLDPRLGIHIALPSKRDAILVVEPIRLESRLQTYVPSTLRIHGSISCFVSSCLTPNAAMGQDLNQILGFYRRHSWHTNTFFTRKTKRTRSSDLEPAGEAKEIAKTSRYAISLQRKCSMPRWR